MRIKLEKGRQKELILLSKKGFSWMQLAERLNLSQGYLKNELRREKTILSEEVYKLLCRISKVSFDNYISLKLDNNWGRSKGGMSSSKNTKEIKLPKVNGDLAEVVGIILGDGHISAYKKGNKIRCYFVRIAGNSKTDRRYLAEYIPTLFERVFNERGSLFFSKNSFVGYFTIYGKNYVEFLKSLGLKHGNKKTNKQTIPDWIKNNKRYLSRCIRGLIDTDGSIHYISKYNLNLRINYTSYITKLLNDVRDSLIILGFNPSKIINRRQIFLSRQKEIKKYVDEVGFGNQKNLNRLKILQKKTPR